jgi:polyphosphate kinase
MLELIEFEAQAASENRPARIIAKMNSLIEPKIINALYEASQAGVKITLIVRGICSLRPGIDGLSENIEVRSIIGRFLEHTRVFYFLNGDNPLVYLSSADWMGRNFFNRVEPCFPIEDKKIKKRVIKDLNYYIEDNYQAWLLQANGKYKRVKSKNERVSAQENLLLELAE